MSLFNPYTKRKIERNFTIDSEDRTLSNPIYLCALEHDRNKVYIKISQKGVINDAEKYVSFIFKEDELDLLIDRLSDLRDDLKNNKKCNRSSCPKDDLVNLFFDIVENHYGYKNSKKNTPEPIISIIKKDEKYFLTVVDFKNKNVLLYHEIFLEENGFILNKDQSSEELEEIHNQIIDSVSDEIIQAANSEVDPSDLIYIANFKSEDYNNLKEVIKDYVKNVIKIEN